MAIAAGAINIVVSKLGSLLSAQYKLQKGVKEDIQFLQRELKCITAALDHVSAVPAEELNKLDKAWAWEARELFHDIEDVVDIFIARGCREHDPAESSNFKGLSKRATNLFKNMKTRFQIANEIKKIKNRVGEVSARRDRYKDMANDANRQETVTSDPRIGAMYRDAAKLVGIEGPKEKLKRLLEEDGSSTTKQPKRISIVGFGGMGKTTLANALLRDLQAEFKYHFFVSVSQKPDIVKIFKDILRQLDKKKYANKIEAWGEMNLIDEIREFLQNQRCFCVIDDIWDENVWDRIKHALRSVDHGSKIIVTTRNMSVAERVAGNIYKADPLSENNSRKLFKNRIFGSKDVPHHLIKVTEEILNKCGGVPLAIITISSLLASKPWNTLEWEEVSKSIGTGLERNLDVDNMMKILSLSYYDLPSYLKPCLLLLSKYPEDKVIRKDDLVWSWLAEGFITHEGQPRGKRLQEIGEDYFSDLINRSLIQPVNDKAFTTLRVGQVYACRLHDMVLELIIRLSAEEGFITTLLPQDQQTCTSTMQKEKIRRLSLHKSSSAHYSKMAREQLFKVRSLDVFGSADLMPPLSRFSVLRVLQLEDCSVLDKSHLMNLEKLYLLRFLRLWRLNITELPESIGKLESLETLDIRKAESAVLLPRSFGKLGKLERLLGGKLILPEGTTLGNMKSLQELVDICASLPVITEIGKLTELRVLRIHIDTELGRSDRLKCFILKYLSTCTNLQELVLITPGLYSLDFMAKVPSSLQRFMSNGTFNKAFPRWINSSASSLTNLSLRLNDIRVLPDHLKLLAELPCLRFLYLNEIGFADDQEKLTIQGGESAFQCLTDFHFECGLMFLKFGTGAMPKLQRLFLRFAIGFTHGPFPAMTGNFDFGLENLPSSIRHVLIQFSNGENPEAESEAQSAIQRAINNCPGNPSLDIGSGRQK